MITTTTEFAMTRQRFSNQYHRGLGVLLLKGRNPLGELVGKGNYLETRVANPGWQ